MAEPRPVTILNMFGEILSKAIKVTTLPIDMANCAADILVGGNGSKKSRMENVTPLSLLEEVRDGIAECAKDCDKD